MSLPAWCRAEQVGVMQHTEEEVRGTRSSAGEAGVCVGVAAVCGGAVLCLCAAQGEGVCSHTCALEQGRAGSLGSTCGSMWRDAAACPRRGCVCATRVCGCAQPPCRPGSALAVLALPWHLLHAGTAGLRRLGHAEGMWVLSCLFQTSQGGGMGELTNFL